MNYIFGRKINEIIHGGDYNPEQWLDRPDILQKDIEYMKEAGINEAKEIGRKIAGHAEQTRVSLRAKLAEAQEEARRQNEEKNRCKRRKI